MTDFPFWTNLNPGLYGPTDTYTVIRYNNSELQIHVDKLVLIGDIKETAFALAKEVAFNSSANHGCKATSFNKIIRIVHGQNDIYTLEYLGDNEPEFFNELRFQYERICKMKLFI